MLVDVIRRYRGDQSIRAYARRLDVSLSTLWLVLNGEREASRPFLDAFLRAFPEAEDEVGAALAADARRSPDAALDPATALSVAP